MLNWQMCVASAAKSGKKCNWRKKNFAPKETNEGKPMHTVTKKKKTAKKALRKMSSS